MRIAVLTSSYPRYAGDGTAPFIRSLAESYIKLGHTVEVVAPYDPAVDSNSNQENPHITWYKYIWPAQFNVMGHGRSLKGDARLGWLSYVLLPFYLLMGIFTLYRVCRKGKIEVIHANWVLPNGPIALVVSRLLKIPFVLSLHGSDIYVSRKKKIFAFIARKVFQAAGKVTACSQDLKDAAIQLGSSEDKTHLLAWGADPEIFSPERYSIPFRKELGVLPEHILVAAVGRLVHKKGFDVLISAWKSVSEKHPNARLIVGGDGPLRKILEDQAKSLGIMETITFIGRVSWQNMPVFLASADIFVLPSVRDRYGNMDGLPTVLLEAMSSGVACVASELGGVPLVLRNRHNGILVQGGSKDELSGAINHLIVESNLRKEMGKAARLSVVDEFNWRAVGQKMAAHFRVAIQKSKAARPPKRLGVIYRKKYIQLLLQDRPISKTNYVLDIGSYDGESVRFLDMKNHIAVDLAPESIYPEIQYVKADGCFLPFKKECFDVVFALDVIEHIEDDRQFAEQIKGALAPEGRLILTTPSLHLRLYPKFLTKWISHKWGHDLRIGYTSDQLMGLFSDHSYRVEIQSWSALLYRRWYLLARFLLPIFPRQISEWVNHLAELDFENQDGDDGFWVVKLMRP